METKHVIQVGSFIGNHNCEFCGKSIPVDDLCISKVVNHYLSEHSCSLLHIGSLTGEGWEDDGLWHGVVAMLGSESVPETLPQSEESKKLHKFINRDMSIDGAGEPESTSS